MTAPRRPTPPRTRPHPHTVHFIATCAYCHNTIVRERRGVWEHLDAYVACDCPTQYEPDDDG